MATNRADLYRLILAIKEAASRIGFVRDAITVAGKETVDAIAENTEAAKETAKKQTPPPSRITVDVNIPREEINRYYAEHKKPNSLQWWTFTVNVLTLLAVTWYARITDRQRKTMDATLKEAQLQTGISRRLAETSDKSYRLEQRAWIVVSTKGPIVHTVNMRFLFAPDSQHRQDYSQADGGAHSG